MLQLELLWRLQCIDRELNSIKKDNKSKQLYQILNNIKNEYNSLKEKFQSDVSKLDENKKKVSKQNIDLRELDEKLKGDNKKLYDEGSSIKVIDSLEKEIEMYKKSIDSIENGLLLLIDENDKLELSVSCKRNELSELKSKFEALKKQYVENNDIFKQKIEELTNNREKILKEIDTDLITQYNNIAAKKNNPVSEVRNASCGECGVGLNSMLYEKLKKRNSICICDNCERILYIE